MKPKDVAMRKRTQILKANRTMFIWVAGVSVIFGFALVGSIFLTQKLLFNERVLGAKQTTINVLKADNAIVSDLEDKVRVLDTDQDLNSIKAHPTDQAVQVILDALPSEANSLALGASLQDRLLAGIPGLTINSLETDPVSGVETSSDDPSAAIVTSTVLDQNAISFSFNVSGPQAALKQVLTNLELSIRLIKVTSIQVDADGNNQQTLSVHGEAFYEPAVTAKLTESPVK